MNIATQSRDYKPTKGEQAMVAHNQEIIRLADFNKRLDERAHQPKERVIRVVYRGGWYRASYEGSDQYTLGTSPSEARSRLKYFDGASSSHKKMMRDKFEGAN